jgi:TonB family protein
MKSRPLLSVLLTASLCISMALHAQALEVSGIPLFRLLELAKAARDASGDSPKQAVATFMATLQREGHVQGGVTAAGLEVRLLMVRAEPPPSVRVSTLQDRQMVALVMQLQNLEPLTGKSAAVPQTDGVCFEIQLPNTLTTADIERLVLMRNGKAVPPTLNQLTSKTITSRMGVSVTRHSGAVCWPVSAFSVMNARPMVILFLNEGEPVELEIGKEDYDYLTGRSAAKARQASSFGMVEPRISVRPDGVGGNIASAEPLRVGGNIKTPTQTKHVPPIYPSIAQAERVQGVVMIEAIVGADGQVKEAKVIRSIPLLDQAALDAVKQWQFTPTVVNGLPVPIVMTLTVNFTLQLP